MTTIEIHYVTNRRHIGKDRWNPTGYSHEFSRDGADNLRFGRVRINLADARWRREVEVLRESNADSAGWFRTREFRRILSETAEISAYEELVSSDQTVAAQLATGTAKLGSRAMFGSLKELMTDGADSVLYIHGFNNDWWDAVAEAVALQLCLNPTTVPDAEPWRKPVKVVLFTWPSDGEAIPWRSYAGDRAEAGPSGEALGRLMLIFRDWIREVAINVRAERDDWCGQDVHLVCHSMGNYVLQSALRKMREVTGTLPPRVFRHAFMAAADVDDDSFESNDLRDVTALAESVVVYANRNDTALQLSESTKHRVRRLGFDGPSRPSMVHRAVSTVDCTDVVESSAIGGHSYFYGGRTGHDMAAVIAGPTAKRLLTRDLIPGSLNTWILR
jgi:esterase/lipase superfamily enzyme